MLRWAFGSRLPSRLHCGVLPSVHACLFSFVRKKETACGVLRFYSARVEIAIRTFSRCWRGYLPWLVHFRFARFFMAISTELPGMRGNGDGGYEGTGLATRPLCAFALPHWLCNVFRGEYVGGCAPPNLRQRVFDSLDSLHLIRGKVPLIKHCNNRYPELPHPRTQHPGTRKDLTGSDLWPVRSCCISMLPTRANVQTRAALKRRRVGLRARSGVEAALPAAQRPLAP